MNLLNNALINAIGAVWSGLAVGMIGAVGMAVGPGLCDRGCGSAPVNRGLCDQGWAIGVVGLGLCDRDRGIRAMGSG